VFLGVMLFVFVSDGELCFVCCIVDYFCVGKSGWKCFVLLWCFVGGVVFSFFLFGVIVFVVFYNCVDVLNFNELVMVNVLVVYWLDGKIELGRFGEVNCCLILIE